jgi:D-arabinose 1-dehydrogenase-like Zn-dependent alcohol dehydrogenase
MNRLLLILTFALHYVSALRLTRRAIPGVAAAATAAGSKHAIAAAKPVLVLGANGGTGLECVKYLQKKGRPCIAATRTGEFVGDASKLVTVAKGTRMCLHAIDAATAAPLTARRPRRRRHGRRELG